MKYPQETAAPSSVHFLCFLYVQLSFFSFFYNVFSQCVFVKVSPWNILRPFPRVGKTQTKVYGPKKGRTVSDQISDQLSSWFGISVFLWVCVCMCVFVRLMAGTIWLVDIRLSFTRLLLLLLFLLLFLLSPQMSHSLSLEVIEMAEAAALLDRLASGLDEFPSRSTVPSSSARERTEPPDRTCCWSLKTDGGKRRKCV